MKYGLSFPNGGPCGDARTLGELARLAEDSGWDGVFLEDYIVWQGHQDVPTYDPWIALAAMAMQTKHIRLGTMVTPLSRRRPWKLAREAVTLDHLSGGRVILGVGLGETNLDVSFSHFGEVTDDSKRAKMVNESLAILEGLWSGEPFSFHGEHYHIDEVTFLPRPVQQPRIPIWIGGVYRKPGAMERAARYDGAALYKLTGGDFTPDEIRDIKSYVEQHRKNKIAPYDIASGGRHRDEDWNKDRALIKSLGEAGMTWWVEYTPPELGGIEEIRAYTARGPLRVD
ncbi:MAG: LLM class flavin-dependent oxidoreductase [Chloroflexi bacterium]|nr:LLM class flavin-dependent oxidoreductase [Chloroflexota bacterium]